MTDATQTYQVFIQATAVLETGHGMNPVPATTQA